MAHVQPVSVLGAAAQVLDGVHEAAGPGHDGQRAVALGDELGEAAGLETGRHQQEVRARVDRVDEDLVEGVAADTPGVLRGQLGHARLQVLVAGAGDDDLPAEIHDALDRVQHQVDALLVGQARGHGEEGCGGLGREAQAVLEPGLVGGLALGDVRHAVTHGRAGVGAGIGERGGHAR